MELNELEKNKRGGKVESEKSHFPVWLEWFPARASEDASYDPFPKCRGIRWIRWNKYDLLN